MFVENHIFEIVGLVLGLVYLYQELKASRALWITGMLMPAVSMAVYYRAGLYADFGIDVYYLLAAVWGYFAWRRKGDGGEEIPVCHTPVRAVPLLALAAAGCFCAISFVLVRWTDSTVPFQDAFTTALSIVALYMLSRKWMEQWWVWAVVDAVSAALYVYKGIPFYAFLYSVYTLVAVFGYFRWRKKFLYL